MLRALVFVGALAVASPAAAATYAFQGDGECFTLETSQTFDCSARLSFSIDPADYGKEVPLTDWNLMEVTRGAAVIHSFYVIWVEDYLQCTDECAFATTDANGTLLDMWGHCIGWCGLEPSRVSETSWSVMGQDFMGSGSWTHVVVPLPAGLPLLLTALAAIGLLPKTRLRQHCLIWVSVTPRTS